MNAALQGRKGALHRGNTSSMADKPSFAFLEAILNCELGNPLTHSGKQCGYTLPSEEVNLWCSETTAGLAFLLTTPKALSALSPSLSTTQRCPLRSILWRNNGGAMARFPAPSSNLSHLCRIFFLPHWERHLHISFFFSFFPSFKILCYVIPEDKATPATEQGPLLTSK